MPLRRLRLLFLQIEIEGGLLQAYRNVVEVEHFFTVFAQHNVVLAGLNTQREVLALVIGFQRVLLPGIHVLELDRRPGNRIALNVFAQAFDRCRCLSPGLWRDQRDGYQLTAEGLLAGGVDLLIVETSQDLLQAKAAIIGARRAMAVLPVDTYDAGAAD